MGKKVSIWCMGLFLFLFVFHIHKIDADTASEPYLKAEIGLRSEGDIRMPDVNKYDLFSEEYVPFDSTKVYRVKYLNGEHTGKFLGANDFGTDTIVLDAVYGTVPNGQFIVCRENTWMLQNRIGGITLADGGYTATGDSLQPVFDSVQRLPNQFTNGTDTFEIVAFADGTIDVTDPRIGYKYFTPLELTNWIFTVGYSSTDAFDGCVLGFNANDARAVLLAKPDSAFFLFVPSSTTPTGSPSIANIAPLERTSYRLRSYSNPQLYLTVRNDSLIMDGAAYSTTFYLKKDATSNVYAIIDANATNSRKMFVDATRRLFMAPLDSIHTHWFEISSKINPILFPTESIVDTTHIYKVKYLNGPDSGYYFGANMNGYKKLLDTVYAHLPEGQFVVRKENKFTLDSRVGWGLRTGRYETNPEWYNYYDSLKVVIKDGFIVDNQFTNTVDTFEIVAIDYGDIDTHISNPYLGYKYFTQEELSEQAFAFQYQSADALNNAYIGYKDVNIPCVLTSNGEDTARFVVEPSFYVYSEGASAIGTIPKLQRRAYRFYSVQDTNFYLRMDKENYDSIMVMKGLRSVSDEDNLFFYLKEDTIPNTGNYAFIIKSEYVDNQAKMFAAPNRQLFMGPIDSLHTHVFKLEVKDRFIFELDPYNYMQALTQGVGLYEMTTTETDGSDSYLTRNFYSNAVFRKEGESILRAGSYIPSDFHLWIDVAQTGTAAKPDKTSYYIVREVDTLKSKFNISGYFLHVMDSIAIGANEDNTVTIDGKYYNRVNFEQATRASANTLLLDTTTMAKARDSVGFVGKNEKAINEFRFYLQQASQAGKYYIVTEQGYGGKVGIRGYLSIDQKGNLYFGPRDGAVRPVTLSLANMVANEAPPFQPVIQTVDAGISIIGGKGMVHVQNGMGQQITVYNVVGQQIARKMLDSDNESIPIPRGIAIVQVANGRTQKVVVN